MLKLKILLEHQAKALALLLIIMRLLLSFLSGSFIFDLDGLVSNLGIIMGFEGDASDRVVSLNDKKTFSYLIGCLLACGAGAAYGPLGFVTSSSFFLTKYLLTNEVSEASFHIS